MEIGAVQANRSISLNHIVRASYSKSKISIPVNTSSFGFVRFKHIKGVPSFSGNSGYSFSSLKQLDSMIEFANKLKNKRFSVDLEGEDPTLLEKMIEKYSRMIREQVTSPLSAEYSAGVYFPGSVMNLTA
jgi:hypothetical protein